MAEDKLQFIPITGAKKDDGLSVKYEEVYDMKELYKLVRDWLISEGFASDKKDEYMEEFYLENHNQTRGREIWVWWRTSKVPHGSIYFKYYLNVDFHVLGMKDVEIMYKGQKVKAQKGEVEVIINAYIELLPEAKLKGPLKVFSDLFRKRIYKGEIKEHEDKYREDVYRLQGLVKQFLELKGFLPESEIFRPLRGL